MATVEASVEIAAPLADVWSLYFDRERWPAWVDGFASLASASEGYPEGGGELRWRSTPAGRGEVSERVLAHQPRSLHRIAFEDPATTGELETRFEMQPAGEGRVTRVAQSLSYRLRGGGPLAPLTDLLFIRSQQRRSLQRSLIELRLEAERTGATSI
jgi:uncharacterized protein YndB with AHSA1/START domain